MTAVGMYFSAGCIFSSAGCYSLLLPPVRDTAVHSSGNENFSSVGWTVAELDLSAVVSCFLAVAISCLRAAGWMVRHTQGSNKLSVTSLW